MIIFASFPRSGHHFIINTLSEMGKNLSYCEKYKCEDQFGKKIIKIYDFSSLKKFDNSNLIKI